jgi:hypothetical protein
MIVYQVDQCMNSRRFIETCTGQGLVGVRSFPRGLKGRKDPEVLRNLLPSGCPLLTTDRTIHFDHASEIPGSHPGILIVANVVQIATLTTRSAMCVLAEFKKTFPNWYDTPLKNSVVELTEVAAEVWRVERGQVKRVAYIAFAEPGWQERLVSVLQENARTPTLEANDS